MSPGAALDVHLARVEEAFHLAEELGPVVWPGFDAAGAPILLVDGEDEHLMNVEAAPEGFDRTAARVRRRPVFSRPATFPPNLQATFPALGFETVVVGTAEGTGLDPAAWTLMVCHELFHVHQDVLGLNEKVIALGIGEAGDASWHLSFPFPYQDPVVCDALCEIGQAGGAAAVDGLAAADATERARLALDALFRRVDQRGADYFRYQTAKEGVARYVEAALAERAAGNSYSALTAFVAEAGDAPYRKVWAERYSSLEDRLARTGHTSRDRIELYRAGHSLALLLDRVSPTWKSRLFAPHVWLDTLLPTSP